ncbi:hypothetical protein LRR80_06477 [Streptomyces sp. RO-S4]|nr:hypothetical protein [Streptomyces sp. RO-S4]
MPDYRRTADISATYRHVIKDVRAERCRTKGPIFVAQKVVVTLFDDIDGSEAAETIAFGLDGKSYEIDLNEANARKLREALEPYVDAGRKRARSGKAYRQTEVAPDPAAVRAWAQANRMDVPARGRIPKRVYEAFTAAQ